MNINEKAPRRPHEPPMSEPLAFFLTWTTYGTWLPGDDRGWTERRRGFQLPDPIRQREAEACMADDPCALDDEQRRLVETTIADHCRIRGWELHMVNCRTNHVHVVVTANRDPDEVSQQFKAWCTRRLKELERARGRQGAAIREKWWTEKGSQRRLWDPVSLDAAIQYVRDGQ
jgi:REP element-mobilizing transposase RayT